MATLNSMLKIEVVQWKHDRVREIKLPTVMFIYMYIVMRSVQVQQSSASHDCCPLNQQRNKSLVSIEMLAILVKWCIDVQQTEQFQWNTERETKKKEK